MVIKLVLLTKLFAKVRKKTMKRIKYSVKNSEKAENICIFLYLCTVKLRFHRKLWHFLH